MRGGMRALVRTASRLAGAARVYPFGAGVGLMPRKTSALGCLFLLTSVFGSAAAEVEITVADRVYQDVRLVREHLRSILIRHRGGSAYIDRAQISDEDLSRLTGQSIITPEQRAEPPERPQRSPYEPPAPREPDGAGHNFVGPRSPSRGIFRGLPTGREDVPSSSEHMEHEVFRLVNIERAARGLAPYKWSEDLARAARYHAADMVDGGYFNHDTYDRDEVGGRLVLRKVGRPNRRIQPFWAAYSGENIARGQPSARAVMRSWMSSPGHRNNILAKSSTMIGVGFVEGVWVQNFGRDAKPERKAE